MNAPAHNPALDLILQAGQSRNIDELRFTIVNRSTAICRYDRASLWSGDSAPRLLAVSGVDSAAPDSPFARSWSDLLRGLTNPAAPARLSPDSFSAGADWSGQTRRTGGLSALWIPMPAHGMAALFERWEEAEFCEAEAAGLERLVAAYDLVHIKPCKRPGRARKRLVPLAALLALGAVLALVRVPLRVVAPCEVAARTPLLVSAPMDGVIEEVTVAPGQRVAAGDTLALYDSRLMDEELEISRRQAAVVEAELAEARARGFSDARYRGRTAILEARLEQESARLEALETRLSRRLVTAGAGGTIQMDNARAWRGRPVATGQAIMWLVDPSDTRVSLWLPQDDRIDIDMTRPAQVHLHALGVSSRPARITYVSSFATASPFGGHAFYAEAEWRDSSPPPPIGLRGSASIYGEKASLGYWLLRRPLAKVRLWLGL